MATSTSIPVEPEKLTVRRDLRAVRKLLKRIKRSARLAELPLFGRRNPAQMLRYLDRRLRDRSPVEIPIYVTPAAFDGWHVKPCDNVEREILAITKDVSLRGVGFRHDELLEGHYAIVVFDLIDDLPVSLLLEIRWLNLQRTDFYLSGGRFIGITECPEI